jgi:hypothetical protein
MPRRGRPGAGYADEGSGPMWASVRTDSKESRRPDSNRGPFHYEELAAHAEVCGAFAF